MVSCGWTPIVTRRSNEGRPPNRELGDGDADRRTLSFPHPLQLVTRHCDPQYVQTTATLDLDLGLSDQATTTPRCM